MFRTGFVVDGAMTGNRTEGQSTGLRQGYLRGADAEVVANRSERILYSELSQEWDALSLTIPSRDVVHFFFLRLSRYGKRRNHFSQAFALTFRRHACSKGSV